MSGLHNLCIDGGEVRPKRLANTRAREDSCVRRRLGDDAQQLQRREEQRVVREGLDERDQSGGQPVRVEEGGDGAFVRHELCCGL